MRVTRLYTEQVLEAESEIRLQQEQTHYLSNVLRMRVGDSLKLFNGQDDEYDARVISLSRKESVLQVIARHERQCESPLAICLGIGVSRAQHMDFSLQKAVELGVQTIVPVLSDFSNVKLQQNRLQNKMAHWQSIVTNATEQCGRTRLAALSPPLSYAEFVNSRNEPLKLIFHPEASTAFADIEGKPDNVCLLIGPEGGFSNNEIEQALSHDFMALRFGPRTLRAETAVVAAVTACQSFWGDLGA